MRYLRRSASGTVVALALCSVLASCTGGDEGRERGTDTPGTQAAGSTYRTVPCPDRVVSTIVGEVECGFLSVPERREPDQGTVEVFVTRVQPPEGSPKTEPVLVVGTNIATAPNYAGISPLSQRTGREVLIVAPRGVGFSRPSLECPEVERSGDRALRAASDDPEVEAAFLLGFEQCHSRLTAAGVHVSAYGPSAAAADLVDLRSALGIEQWNVVAYGTASRVAVELLRTDAEHVRAVLLDSPELPGMDPGQLLRTRAAQAVRAILAACRDDTRCARRHAPQRDLLAEAEQQLRRRPVVLRTDGAGGDSREVTLDAPRLHALLRGMVSDGGSAGRLMTPGAVPKVLAAVRDRQTDRIGPELLGVLTALEPHCLGIQPQCAVAHDTSMGALATAICQRDGDAGAETGGGKGVWGLWEPTRLCQHWPVDTAPTAAMPAVDVPALVTVGAFATYSPPDAVSAALEPWSAATVLVDRGGGHNVVGRTECMIALRNAWLDRPTGEITPPACLNESTIDWYL